jgi:hypothetical protein
MNDLGGLAPAVVHRVVALAFHGVALRL